MRDVFVHRVAVLAGEALLDADELRARVALVGEEVQARLEPAERVAAVDERVAAAQQRGAAVALGVGQPHVRLRGDQRPAVGALGGEVERGELVLAAEGAPVRLCRPMTCSWSPSESRSQVSIVIRIRRATR